MKSIQDFQQSTLRKSSERRKKNAVPPARYLISGQRKEFRRESDANSSIFIDKFSPDLFMLVALIMIMSAMDCFFTLIHLDNGATEMNPMMDIAIQNGDGYFFVTKYALTALGVVLLCLYKNFVPTKKIIGGIFIIYFVLTLYHIAHLL